MDLGAIGQQFGLSPQQTQAAVEALGPVIAAGMRRNASSGGGGLGDILGGMLNGGGAVDPTSTGNDILGEIFGSKEVSRGVANQMSASTGIGAAVLKKLLPILASVIMAQMASKGGSGGGGLGDILGQVLGGGQGGGSPAPRGDGGLGDVLGGGSVGRSPQGGGAGGGLGDILGQILQGGGAQPQPGGGGLGDILGSILGGAGQQQSGAGSPADILLEQLQKSLGGR